MYKKFLEILHTTKTLTNLSTYGRHGLKIIEHLKTNPFAVLPIVMTKALYLSEWDSEYLCHEAVSRVDNNGGIMFGDDDDVEEYVKEELKKQMELHRDAYALMSTYTASDAFENSPWRNDGVEISRLEISRVWLEFMMPFYDYPLEMVLGETHTHLTKCNKKFEHNKIVALFPPNIRVKTCFGEGKIIKVIDEGTRKYQIQTGSTHRQWKESKQEKTQMGEGRPKRQKR
ncbi:hypothetical protein ScalyP_jg8304 [Parmales sp. scaly parma]|nr:hypothetical protein ScalyP_jg8304 [Parmales sp. scaly parma]